VGDAVTAYPAKLLNRSANFYVELMRDELNEAAGAPVRSSGDPRLMMLGARAIGAGPTPPPPRPWPASPGQAIRGICWFAPEWIGLTGS
jgi:hypothetical protein